MSEQRKSMHGEWTSGLGFMMATTGAAVGLGNIWKFPYIAGENGGGAFVLVYLICIALLGIPIMMAEISIGRRGRQNPAGTMRTVAIESGRSTAWRAIGGIIILAGFLILSYYSVIAGWALDYVFQSALGHFNNATATQVDDLFNHLVASPLKLTIWHTLIMGFTIAVVAFGVEKGLERAVKFMFPLMLLLLLIIVGYSIETGFFGLGVSFLFHPNFHELTPNGMLIALGHSFFTLSLATGTIMMYGAYVPQNISIPKASFFIALADTLIALIAGLAIFPIVFAHGLQPSAGPGLIFKTLPLAFGQMQYGSFIATTFFIMLVFAAFTSAISLIEPATAWAIEKFNISRIRAVLIIGFSIWFLGLGTVLSFNYWADFKIFGLNFFEFIDYLTANIMLPLGGFLIAIFAAWFMKKEYIVREMNASNGILYKFWHYTLGFTAPIAIGIVFLNFVGIIKL